MVELSDVLATRRSSHSKRWIPRVYCETIGNVQIIHSYHRSYCVEISKFLELLHIVDNIERFGTPMNYYCAQRPESLLIPVAKKPGRRSQERQQGVAYKLQERNACHTPSLLTPCIHVCWILRLQNPQPRLQTLKSAQPYEKLAEPRLLQWLASTILKFHTASKLPSHGKQKRTLRAWIPRLRYQNSCCKHLAIQNVFVLKSGLAKISFNAIPVFSPMGQCTIGLRWISEAQCIRAVLRRL